MRKKQSNDYNTRLFSGGLRGRFHFARFEWLRESLRELGGAQDTVVELGCYDGKTINFLGKKPRRYLGFDENWEGGLPIARELWAAEKSYEFRSCSSPSEMLTDERFDLAICMETLEHVPPAFIEPYVARMAELTRGHILITVPTEKGPVFAAKHLYKRLFGNYQPYTLAEYVNAALGRLHKVERNDHKGFDYQVVIDAVQKHFRVIKTTPYPIRALPLALGFGIGIVAKSR